MKLPSARYNFWWLKPSLVFTLMCGGTLLMAYWQNDVEFQLYNTSKYVETWHVLVGLLSIAVFAVGCYLGRTTAESKPVSTEVNPRILWFWFYLCVGLTVFGYLVWFGMGVKNGARPGILLEILKSDDAELVENLREDYFPTIPGITTCTQFGLPAILLGLWLYFQENRKALYGILPVACLGLIRAMLFSERSALIELCVPSSILIVRLTVMAAKEATWMRSALNIAPLVAPVLLAIVFGAFEYVRSWHYYVDQFDSYPQFVSWRLSGYYTTAHNNAAMAIETNQYRPLPYYTIAPFWQFPGVEQSPLGYEELTGVDMDEHHKDMLENFGNPELNNEGGLFQPLLDWGLPGSLVFWVGYGFLAGMGYYYFLQGNLGAVLLFPMIYHSILDVPRLLLICHPRLTPALATLIMVFLANKFSTEK